MHYESAVAVTERQEKGMALKSAKMLLVEHRLLKHADSRETMQTDYVARFASCQLSSSRAPYPEPSPLSAGR